ncbi:MAG: carbon starvation CstA family protein [Kiritimatiellae bacterium]|nr:carbon starvation CstA family protein [Kiritimatiellia bacterium]
MLTIIFIAAILFFIAAYFFYGRFLEKRLGVNDARPTPAHAHYDGFDWVPARPAVLFGHHFSSIAGAGPIVGPIIASLAFGWLPALLWVLIGAVFIGGVQDFAALFASIRHGGRSLAQIARASMSPLAFRLLLVFIWLALVYVLTVFTDLTAETFVNDGGVASSSMGFILLALGFGVCIYRFKFSIRLMSLLFVPLVFLFVWLGQLAPIPETVLREWTGMDPKKAWCVILIIYCFVASTVPVWMLLQPRDYLSSYLLYVSVIGGFLGILMGGFTLSYPAFKSWHDHQLGHLAPIIFITIACGACSGFHSLVASGTTSKQIDRERDALKIGYGGMLVEGVVAVMALLVVAMLPLESEFVKKAPLAIYSNGMAKFLGVFGVPIRIGSAFGLLALSTFILTTLDTATRLSRYIFEEFFNIRGAVSRYFSTAATLVLPLLFVLMTIKDAQGNPLPAWKAVWPVFGATNQLLAGLALLVVMVWLKSNGKRTAFIFLPMIFMVVMTVWALFLLIGQYKLTLIGIIAAFLLLLALLLVIEGARVLLLKNTPAGRAGQPVCRS